LTECFYNAFKNNFNSYKNAASQSIESIAKMIINDYAKCMKETFPLLHIHRARNPINVEDVVNFAVRKNRRLDFI
jgi:hypothetical protein